MSGEYYEQVVLGPAKVYAGVFGVITDAPTDANVNTTPAASAWTNLEGTNGGTTWSHDIKTTTLMVDQTPYNIGDRVTGVDIQVVVTLANASLANLALALNTTIGATGTGFATLEPNYGASASQMPATSLLIDGFAPQGTLLAPPRRRLYLPRCSQVGKISAVYAKDKQVGWDCTFNVYYVSDQVAPYHITDQTDD